MSPVLRQGTPLVSGLGPRAPPGLAERGRKRIDTEDEVVRQRAQQRGLAGAGSAHAPRDGAQKLVAALGLRCFAEDVETVANLHLLDFAEITVEFAKRVAAAVRGLDAAILVEPDGGGKLQDARAQGRATTRIDRGRVEELVHQPLQLLQCAVAAGAGQRRRQVIDDDRSAPPLGLAALAGVVHDEGIDVRERPERGFRKAFGGERQRLARQPFHVAVLAHVHHRMGVEGRAHPRVEGEIAMRRRQVGVVVALLRIDVVATRRLDRDDHVAEPHRRECKASHILAEEGVCLRLSPALGDGIPDRLWQRGEEARVVRERERGLGRFGAGIGGVGGACREPRHQRRAVHRPVFHPVAGFLQGLHDPHRARRRVETDAVADAPVAVGVVGEHQSHPALRRCRTCEAHPGGGECGDEAAALLVGLRHHHGRLCRLVEARLGLEGDRTGQNAPVDLGQRHVHGDIAGREAARGLRPLPLRGAGEDRLQHGHASLGEGGLLRRAGPGDRKARGVQDDPGLCGAHECADQLRRRLVSQAGDEDGQRVEACVLERRNQRIHGRERASLQQRPIEDHARPRRAVAPMGHHVFEREHALAPANRGPRAAPAGAGAIPTRGRSA